MSYSPAIGTWLEKDPTGAEYVDGADLYRAFSDDPVSLVDPLGMTTHNHDYGTDHGTIAAAFGYWKWRGVAYVDDNRTITNPTTGKSRDTGTTVTGAHLELSYQLDLEGQQRYHWVSIVQIFVKKHNGIPQTGDYSPDPASNYSVDVRNSSYSTSPVYGISNGFGTQGENMATAEDDAKDDVNDAQGKLIPGIGTFSAFDIALGYCSKDHSGQPTILSTIKWGWDYNGASTGINVNWPGQFGDVATPPELYAAITAWNTNTKNNFPTNFGVLS